MSERAHDLPEDFEGNGGVATVEGDIEENGDEPVAADAVPIGELTVAAPEGAEWKWSKVKTNRGTVDLGDVPILRWTSLEAAKQYYGEEAALDALNDTGLRVPFQGIARRGRASGKLDANGIAQEQIDYRPGAVQRNQSTAASRAKSAAARAAEQLGDEGADLITTLMNRVAKGELTLDQLKQQLGGG